MYIPDWAIVNQLQRYDAALRVKWNTKRERWQLWREVDSIGRLYKREVLILTLENDDGSFRPLDERLVRWVRLADAHRYHRSADKRMHDQMKKRAAEEIESNRAYRKDMEDMTRDHFPSDMAASLGANNRPKEDYLGEVKELIAADERARQAEEDWISDV